MDSAQIDSALRRYFEENRPDIVSAWLFGSTARGTRTSSSDVDVAILLAKDPPRTLASVPVELLTDLHHALRPAEKPVDVVLLNRASCDLVHRVLRDGRLLIDRDPSARVRFEVRARNQYFDLKPFLDRYRRRERQPPAMTDADLVAKKLARIETSVQELRTLVRPDEIAGDIVRQRFAEHTLQIAIQAALDVASRVVSDERLGEPETNAALFELLARGGWLSRERVETLVRMTGFRNVLVHGYDEVDLAVVEDVLRNHLDDLLEYVAEIRKRLPPA